MKAERKAEDTPPASENIRKKTVNKETSQKNKNEKLQPLPEQLRIAQLLDNGRREDPRLKEKLKEVMEATKKSMDEAYIALHDSDFDPNKAVTLLLEGTCTQWSTLPKKKRTKIPCPKQATDGKTTDSPKHGPVAAEVGTSEAPVYTARPIYGNRGGNSRGRGSYRGGRNQERQHADYNKKKIYNNLDNDIPKVIETRYFERARASVVRPEDTWDPNRPVSELLNAKRHDLDEEEYTGSLSKSLVITSSSFGKSSASSEGVAEYISKKICEEGVKLPDPDTEKNIILPAEELPKLSFRPRAPPATASVLKGPPRVEKVVSSPTISSPEKGDEVVPRSTPSSVSVEKIEKITLNPVEMPPGSDSSVRLLDVTFGAIDLNEQRDEEEHKSTTAAPIQIVDPPVTTEKPADLSRSAESIRESSSTYYSGISLGHGSRGNQRVPRAVHSSTYNTDALNAMYQNSATFTAAPTAQSNSGITPVHYSNYTTTQPLPLLQNPFQGVMAAQTYTSNSQYGSLPSTTYIPYASYSSMVQSQKLPGSSFGKELDGTSSGGSALNYGIVSQVNDAQTTKSSGVMSKNSVLSNMPVVGPPHQIILGQGTGPYFQPNHLYHTHTPSYQEMQLIQQQQRLSSHYNQGYYDMTYPTANSAAAREGPPAFPPPPERFLSHTNHLQAAGPVANDHASNSIMYGTDFGSHYGPDTNCVRPDVKSFMQQVPISLALKSQTKVNSYE